MICPKCKKEIPDDARLCCYCGRHFVVERGHSKRGNGTGTAYMHHGSWTVRVTIGSRTDDNGKLHQIYRTKGGFKKKSDALAYAETLKTGALASSGISMDKLFTEWSESYQKRVGASTMAGYKAAYKHFGDIVWKPIATIRPAELQAQIDACEKGKRTKQLMKVTAGLLWKYALDNDIVRKNITGNLYTGNDATTTRAPFSDLELKRIREAVGKEPYADYVVALCFTGFRPGELLELKKNAVNAKKNFVIGGGKTEAGTDRIVTIPPAIREIIAQRMEVPGEYLFPNQKTGRRMSHEYFRKYCFDPLMEKLGIVGKVPYSCRHTYSNLLKRAPGDSGDKARLMGHTDYTFTQERYQSADLRDLETITDALI